MVQPRCILQRQAKLRIVWGSGLLAEGETHQCRRTPTCVGFKAPSRRGLLEEMRGREVEECSPRTRERIAQAQPMVVHEGGWVEERVYRVLLLYLRVG